MTTWSIDYAFMIDNEVMERVVWDETKDTVFVSDDLATEGIRARLVSVKGNGELEKSRTTSKNLDTAVRLLVSSRIKNQRFLTSSDCKRSNALTIPVNSPVGDSQSNGRVENAIEVVRNVVKTIFSSLESRWGVRVARDHPVHPWVFEWAADLITKYEHVGDLGKTAVQLIGGSKSSRNTAQFGEKILYIPLTLSGHHRGNMEDTFLGVSGHETAIR